VIRFREHVLSVAEALGAVTPAHAWLRRAEPFASLLTARRKLLGALGLPGYG
jgi:hypothetical protein